jgi:hypothetical protein
MKLLCLMAMAALFSATALCICTPNEQLQLNYTLHFENGTSLAIDRDSPRYSALNDSTMKFLEFIAYASERQVTSQELDKELSATKYLEVNTKDAITVQTIQGLNSQWPQGWDIATKKIIIKLGTVEAEERIFTFHEQEPTIRAWRSLKGVDTIIL